MKSLYLRIYATVVAVLLLFALISAFVVERHLDQERVRNEQVVSDRLGAWADLLQHSLPGIESPPDVQVAALREWSQRLRLPLALDDAHGTRIGASDSFLRRSAEGIVPPVAFRLDDGRTLWTMRPGQLRQAGQEQRAGQEPRGPGRFQGALGASGRFADPPSPPWPLLPPGLPRGVGLAIVLVVLFIAVSAGAYPVVRRLTHRLEALKQGVEQFGAGQLSHRVTVSGTDEVAAVAASFNVAAARVEAVVQSHRSLLANASHELRSPLARMKMAVSMLETAGPAQRDKLKKEIDRNVGELDALVEEVLLASRLDATREPLHREKVDLLSVAAEEASRVDARVDVPADVFVAGDERLLRRAVRNLLENARRYGGDDISIAVRPGAGGAGAVIRVCDRGAGVDPALRERIFEPFFRQPGHAEQAGGVGLGLSLVKQIAERHGGSVRCEASEGGGSCFTIELPAGVSGRRVARSRRSIQARKPDMPRPASPTAERRHRPETLRAAQRLRRDAADVEGDDVAAAEADHPDRDAIDDQRHGGDPVGAQHEGGDRLRRVGDVEQADPGQQRYRGGDDHGIGGVEADDAGAQQVDAEPTQAATSTPISRPAQPIRRASARRPRRSAAPPARPRRCRWPAAA